MCTNLLLGETWKEKSNKHEFYNQKLLFHNKVQE